jgi:quercetin dioxygenase-like cupin family protein
LQHHVVKDETIYILCGKMKLSINEGVETVFHELTQGDCFHISPGTIHRMEAIEECTVLEVSTPELDDVVRHRDDYGRV